MKKFFAVMMMAFALIVVGSLNNPVAAQNLGTGRNFNEVAFGAVWDAVVDYDIDFLALRRGPSTSYAEIIRIPPGAYIRVNTRGYRPTRSSGFEEVSYQGFRGYASSRYFTIIAGPQWY